MAITLEEKIALAEEVGASAWARTNKRRLAEEQEVKKLTDMQFKLTDREKVEKQIGRKHYLDFSEIEKIQPLPFLAFLSLFCAFLSACAGMFGEFPVLNAGVWINLGLFALLGGGILLACRKTSHVRWMPFCDWREEIPYGAFLAVKEAKEKKIRNFEIAFPAREHKLLNADPIIVGYVGGEIRQGTYGGDVQIGGHMVEVFGWDAGKIYE